MSEAQSKTENTGSSNAPINGFDRFILDAFNKLDSKERAFISELLWSLTACRELERKAGSQGVQP